MSIASVGQPRTLIIGGGASGICLGIKLKERDLPFTILERSHGFGGTWRQNTYPGCGCDVPSVLYHFSFEPYSEWSLTFSKQPEILAYMERLAAKHDLASHALFGLEAVSARYDAQACIWTVTCRPVAGGDVQVFQANILVAARGQLSQPYVPQIEGLETFEGPRFHTSQWDHSVDMASKRVAVIGSGATAIQIVPEVANKAKSITVFQRTPSWYICGFGGITENDPNAAWKRALWRMPGFMKAHRAVWMVLGDLLVKGLGTQLSESMCRRMLRESVSDPELRAKLTPSYRPGCKRVLVGESNAYLRTLQEPHVHLETAPIHRVSREGIVTADGLQEFDVIVLSTGFRATDFLSPMSVEAGGRDLQQVWSQTPRAHLGISVAGFPNYFVLYGPNTNLGTGSILHMLECQANYIGVMVERLRAGGFSSVVVRQDVMDSYNEQLQKDMKGTAYAQNCGSWYTNSDGVVTQNWAGGMLSYWRATSYPVDSEYEWRGASSEQSSLRSRL